MLTHCVRTGRALALALAPVLVIAGCQSSQSSDTASAPQPAPAGAVASALPGAAADRGAFVVRLGVDTIAVESFTRTADRLEVDAALRTPTTVVRHYVVSLSPTGTPTKLEYEGRRVNNSAPPTIATVNFGADTAVVDLKLGDSTQTIRLPARDAIPFVSNSFAMMELATRRAVAAATDSVPVTLVALGATETAVLPVVRGGNKDTLTIWYFGDPMHARVDREGRILGLEGLSTTSKVLVDRVASADVKAFATASAARDAQGQGIGQLSPLDSVRATVGAAHVGVTYSRPFKRGRTIFGGVVPYDKVWRTGANAATSFTTDVPLEMGGTTIPAGSYTLFTLPTQAGWKLIVNKQTGQWGTEYHAEQDLARVDLTTRKLPQPVEQFTIGIEPNAGGGILKMMWDDTELSVPFKPKG
jgi:hypothetical protein